VTGGAGFVGCNVADRILASGRDVIVLDSFAREGVAENASWLERRHGGRLRLVRGDVRDAGLVRRVVADAAAVFHFAAQVAVTTSLADPALDFDVNAGGTMNVLESVRLREAAVPVFYTSTNKVYGNLQDVPLRIRGERYEPESTLVQERGIDERRPLDFHTPYGCSKGAADQYVLDYGRSFGFPTVVFRMSCIYGPRQMGTEDQGWVAHLALLAMRGVPITLYGDGLQVRDVLYVDDLVDAFLLAWSGAPSLSGRAFNIGGGPANTVSLLELMRLLAKLEGKAPEVRYAPWRRGDQRYYVSDTSAFRSATGWLPRVDVPRGVVLLRAALADRMRSEPAAVPVPEGAS
jgi:CDP-paratose 2-epimerase